LPSVFAESVDEYLLGGHQPEGGFQATHLKIPRNAVHYDVDETLAKIILQIPMPTSDNGITLSA
jgi:hypothetical protein